MTSPESKDEPLTFIPLTFSPGDSTASATHLILTLFPEWKASDLEFIRFTDGITNTLLKCVHTTITKDATTGEEKKQTDEAESVLLRAYGKGTNVLIDREKECQSHYYLSRHSLAPPLLARFNNGLIYRFIPGRITAVEDLSSPPIYQAVAKRLGQWHGVIDASNVLSKANATGPRRRISPGSGVPELVDDDEEEPAEVESDPVFGGGPGESGVWVVLDKWIAALPDGTEVEKTRKNSLTNELHWLATKSGLKNLGEVVYAHCDLLHGNVIVMPKQKPGLPASTILAAPLTQTGDVQVTFIDYEYATPAERAFDLANHFAEWGGFECNYKLIPTVSARRDFIEHYLKSFAQVQNNGKDVSVDASEVDDLMHEVDMFRGVPGFYWGIWALIQAVISQIDFDYAAYAEIRLGEYWAWKQEFEGKVKHSERTFREERWASA